MIETDTLGARSVRIVPAIMPVDRNDLSRAAEALHLFTKNVQLDVVDGVFDTNITWPYDAPGHLLSDFDALALPITGDIFWEVHLMTKQPKDLGEKCISMGAKRLIAHIESFTSVDEAREVFLTWHAAEIQAGVSLLLDTPISAIEDVILDVDVVQVMSIAEIGAQGHQFDARAVARIRELRNRFPHLTITVDGGVNAHNAPDLAAAGANQLCVGSAIVRAEDPRAAYEEIFSAANRVA